MNLQTSFAERTGLSEPYFLQHMAQGLGPDLDTKLYGSGSSGKFLLQLRRSFSDNADDFMYECQIEPGHGAHISYVISNARGKKLSAKANRNLFALTQPLGLKRLTLSTAMDGSYHWPRAGFKPRLIDWVFSPLRRQIKDRLNKVRDKISPESYQRTCKALSSWNPKAIWTIADQTEMINQWRLSYFLLHYLHWKGQCDFSDADCMARFTAHTREQPPPAIALQSTFDELARRSRQWVATCGVTAMLALPAVNLPNHRTQMQMVFPAKMQP